MQAAKIRPIYGTGEKMLQEDPEHRKWFLLSGKKVRFPQYADWQGQYTVQDIYIHCNSMYQVQY